VEASAQGLGQVLDEDCLKYRIRSVADGVEVIGEAFARRDSIRGLRIACVASLLRCLTAAFETA
jgi:hypothetical protein